MKKSLYMGIFYKGSIIHYSLIFSLCLTFSHTQSMAHYNKEAPALYTKHEHLRRLAAARGHFCAVARGPATQHYLHLLQQVILSQKTNLCSGPRACNTALLPAAATGHSNQKKKNLGRGCQNAWSPPLFFYVGFFFQYVGLVFWCIALLSFESYFRAAKMHGRQRDAAAPASL